MICRLTMACDLLEQGWERIHGPKQKNDQSVENIFVSRQCKLLWPNANRLLPAPRVCQARSRSSGISDLDHNKASRQTGCYCHENKSKGGESLLTRRRVLLPMLLTLSCTMHTPGRNEPRFSGSRLSVLCFHDYAVSGSMMLISLQN